MSQRVLATPEAGEAITQVKGILDGGLQTTITNLKSQGTILSDPGVWDGALAADFRNNLWPQCTKALGNPAGNASTRTSAGNPPQGETSQRFAVGQSGGMRVPSGGEIASPPPSEISSPLRYSTPW